jgi:hypothetical protein
MRQRQGLEALLEVAAFDLHAAVKRQQRFRAWIGQIGRFEHRDGLCQLTIGTQGLAVGQCRLDILRIGAITLAERIDRTTSLRGRRQFRPCSERTAQRAGNIRRARRGLAAAQRHGKQRDGGKGWTGVGKNRKITHGTSARSAAGSGGRWRYQ